MDNVVINTKGQMVCKFCGHPTECHGGIKELYQQKTTGQVVYTKAKWTPTVIKMISTVAPPKLWRNSHAHSMMVKPSPFGIKTR